MGTTPHVFNVPDAYFQEHLQVIRSPSPASKSKIHLFESMSTTDYDDNDYEGRPYARKPIDHATVMRNHVIVQDVKHVGILIGEEVSETSRGVIDDIVRSRHASPHGSPAKTQQANDDTLSHHDSQQNHHKHNVHALRQQAAAAAVATGTDSNVPEDAKFWALMKNQRTESSMQPRYFVLQGGLLCYYAENNDLSPFGVDFKG